MKILLGALLMGLLVAAAPARRDPPPADILLVIDKSAPPATAMVVQLAGDSTQYVAQGVLKSVCIPVTKINPSFGMMVGVAYTGDGQHLHVMYVAWDPTNPGLEHLNIVADSNGVFPHFGKRHTACQ